MGLWGLIKLILIGFLAWWLYKGVRGLMAEGQPRQRVNRRPEKDREVLDVMVQDPQCGTYLPQSEAITHWSKGKEYFFCSKQCRDDFRAGKPPADAEK